MKIRFTRNCEYFVSRKELFGGVEEERFDAGEEKEVVSVSDSSYDSGSASDIVFADGSEANCVLNEDFETIE